MEEKREPVIEVRGLKKKYRMGQLGGGTLTADLQSWWARVRKKEDPNTKIGAKERLVGTTFWALNGIDLTIYKGEAVGIIGTNGAGKSTLLKILSRITAPTEGEVSYNGRIASMLEVGTGFNGEMTGRENIYMNGAILGMTKEEIDAKMGEIIEFSECGDFIDTPVKRYSSGMYVKLAFSVAAHLDSDIMIMDEVLAVGDIKFQKKCLGKMGDAANSEGRTVLYVSHNMSTVRQLCTRCLVMDGGKIVFDGEVEEAIAYYSECLTINEETYKNLTEGRYISPHFPTKMQYYKMPDNCDFVFNQGDVIDFHLGIHCDKAAKDVAVFLILRAADDTPIAMSMTTIISELSKGTHDIRVKFPLRGITEGKYSLCAETATVLADGASQRYDRTNLFRFSVKKDNDLDYGIQWVSRYFGAISLPRTEIEVDEKE